MIRIVSHTFILILVSCVVHAQVGIGTTNPDPSSVLDISSTSQGILVPRMTTAERIAINNPATGLLVYDTSLGEFAYSNDGSWSTLGNAKSANQTTSKTGWVALKDADYSLTLAGITVNESTEPTNFTNIDLDFSNNASDGVIEDYAPKGYEANDYFDNNSHRIQALNEGDAVEIRLQFDAIPEANNSFLVIALDIGDNNCTIIYQKTIPLLRGADDVNKISETLLLYQLNTFKVNGAKLMVGYSATSGSPGNVFLSDFSMVISRIHAGE
ncbi:hypothetical protein [Aestuariibaculum sediminum]|uniref:Uncharacterized protein n=1 Tax=Aestuariibaculum sediminum TaxID=2770637 RepID=A0A8J6Q6F2_9FLAO|nr:hypothetical protein [Aestuariibaculum sediminum]MBD0831783.1 hypothetical protein [Aestuariibaculum sediminum]